MQAYLFTLLTGMLASTPEAAARYLADGRPPREGDLLRDPELGDALDRFGRDGAAPFYTGDIGGAVSDWVPARGGVLTTADLEAYRVVPRTPLRVAYRGREIFTNPPPSAGGSRLAGALAHLAAGTGRSRRAGDGRGDGRPGSAPIRSALVADRLGSTTHISVLDADGWACSVTCSNGTGSGVTVPGTGIHLNNMLGEDDLAPGGLGSHRVGDRLPSAMAPTVVRADGVTELVVGSAGSSRIRSALLQVVVNVVDRGHVAAAGGGRAAAARRAGQRLRRAGDRSGRPGRGRLPRCCSSPRRNLFFGGCQAVRRDPRTGELSGGADGRRNGAVVVA